jgi:hypothetical protein
MARDSFVHLHLPTDDIQQMEAPSKALHERRKAWINANLDKPTGDLLPWVQKVANEPGSGLTNRQRREWVRKERRSLQTPINELFFQHVIKALRFPEGKLVRQSGGHGNPVTQAPNRRVSDKTTGA